MNYKCVIVRYKMSNLYEYILTGDIPFKSLLRRVYTQSDKLRGNFSPSMKNHKFKILRNKVNVFFNVFHFIEFKFAVNIIKIICCNRPPALNITFFNILVNSLGDGFRLPSLEPLRYAWQ
jgi:hypothetical protein